MSYKTASVYTIPGTKTKLTTHPTGINTSHELQWAGTLPGKPASAKFYSYTETVGSSPVWVWYDSQGREIRRDVYGLNDNKTLVETGYNVSGEVSYITEPYFENAAKTYAAIYTYDRFGRDSTVLTPFGTTAYTYSGLTATVTSPTGTVQQRLIRLAGSWKKRLMVNHLRYMENVRF